MSLPGWAASRRRASDSSGAIGAWSLRMRKLGSKAPSLAMRPCSRLPLHSASSRASARAAVARRSTCG